MRTSRVSGVPIILLSRITSYNVCYTKLLRPNLIICGDYNICHEEIDIHNPKGLSNVSGFLPVERKWIGGFIDSGFIDSFRYLNKEPHNYTWWSYRANSRANNKGWRRNNFV